MKKLLELLGIILITSNAAGPLIANKPNNNKAKIKNSLETLTRQKRQVPKKSVNKNDNPTKSSTPKTQNEQPDIIEKEINLDENYSDNIQKMLKDFMKNNQIDPLRMINNEGIVTTDKFETLAKRKEREDNIKIIEKLEEILQLRKFDESKIRILIFTLKSKNKVKLVINLNNLYLLGFINNQNHYFYFDDELVEKVKQKNKADIETLEKQIKETSNKNQLGKLNKKLKNLQGESLKNDEQKIKTINNAVIKKYNCQKTNLNYTGIYSKQGLNAVNQNINITKENLNKIIADLADYDDDDRQQNQTIKDKLVRLIFITSEAMRFGSYLKCFNYEKNGQKVEFKNIPTNVQEILDGKIDSLKWKDYEDQLIGGWIASSKNLEEKRKEIFKKLNKRIIVSNFLSENNEELNKIFKKSSKQSQNWETNVKPEIESIIKNSNNQEYINLETDILKSINGLLIANEKEINFLKQWDNNLNPSVININKMDTYYNLIRSIIVQGNLDLFELIITKKPELINLNNNDLTFLQVAIANHKIDIVKLLLSHGADANEKGKYDSSALYTATFYGDIDIVKLLLSHGADVNARNNNGLTPLHVAIDREYLNIISILLSYGADVNAKDYKCDLTPLISALSSNNINIFIELITNKNSKDKININEPNKKVNNWTLLHFATQKNQIQFVKLLLAHGANVNAQDTNGNTPLHYAPQTGDDKVKKLLENFIQLKQELIKSESENEIKCIEKRIKKLLKPNTIRLSTFTTNYNLELLSNNLPEIILNAFVEKNEEIKKIGILPGQLYIEDITDNSANIVSPAPNYYTGAVTVKFTLTNQKTVSGAAATQIRSSDEGGGSKRVGVSEQAGTSGTQNQNTNTRADQNNLYNVPADNSYLFWSVATSYLLPVRNNNEKFRNRFIKLFGELQLSYLSYVQTLLQQFDLSNTNNFLQNWYQDATAHRLVRVVFRNRVVNYIERNLDNPTQSNANQAESFRSAIQISENEVVNNYLDRMRNINAWGGEIEILAMNNLLNANIGVGTDSPYQPVSQTANNNIAIYYVELTKGSGVHNHYNFALTPEEDWTNHAIVINDNQRNIPVVDTTKRPDNLPPTTPKPDTNAIKLPVDDHGQHHTILANNNEDDDSNQGNIINAPELTTTSLQKDEYHFVDKKTEEKSLKNDEKLEINLIKNNNKIKQNVPVVNKSINKNIINAQITATKAINKYNTLSKEEKLKKLNEINRYYQTLSENDKKTFKEKLTNTGLAALSGGALTAYGTKMTVSSTATTSVINAEAMEMTPLLSTSTTESLAAAETITVAETAAVEGGVIAGETGTAAALAPETLGLSLVIGGLAIAGTWMYFAFHHHATSDIALPASIHHNVYDNIEKWYKFLAHDKLKIKINKNTWNEIKQNKNSQANITKIIKNKFVINDHSGWGGSVTNEDFNTFVKVIVLHFEQINSYFEILDNENDGFVIITNTEGDWLGIE